MENLAWTSLFAYKDEYVNKVREKIDQIKQERGESLTYKDFNEVDLIHPGGHEGIDKFFTDYPPPSPGRLLEVGIGMGGTSRHINFTYNLDIFGIDYVQGLVDNSVYINSILGVEEKVIHLQGDACSFDYATGSFDIGVALGVFVHIDSNEGILNTCRALKPGALLYIEDYYFVKNKEEFTQEDREIIDSRGMYGVKTQGEMRDLLQEANMEILEMSEFGQNWTLHAWKRADQLAKGVKEGTLTLTEGQFHQYIQISPLVAKDLSHLTVEEIQQTFPSLSEVIDVRDIVFNKPRLSSVYRIIARRIQ